jgi:hypothetical protein
VCLPSSKKPGAASGWDNRVWSIDVMASSGTKPPAINNITSKSAGTIMGRGELIRLRKYGDGDRQQMIDCEKRRTPSGRACERTTYHLLFSSAPDLLSIVSQGESCAHKEMI